MIPKINNDYSCVIQGWMLNIGCSNLREIAAYALVYANSANNQGEMSDTQKWVILCSISDIQKWLMCSRLTAISTMNKLENKNIIKRYQVTINGVTFNRYRAIVPTK